MKKILSLILSVLLILSIIPMTVVSADTNLKGLFLEEECDAQITDVNQTLFYTFTSPIEGCYEFYSVSDFDLFVDAYDAEGLVIGSDDDGNGGGDFKVYVYLNEGESCTFRVGAYDIWHDGRFSVYIKESSYYITKLEVTKQPDKTEYQEGELQYDYDLTGLELKATTQKGKVINWSYDTDSDYIDVFPLDFELVTDSETTYIQISCCGVKAKVELTVIPLPVDSIEILDPPTITLYENCGGYFDYDLDRYIYYYDSPQALSIKVNYNDGTSEIVDLHDEVCGTYFEITDDQYNTPFVLGENEVFVKLGSTIDVFYITILETPVESITFNSVPAKEYRINEEDFISFNEETGVYTLFNCDLTGISFTAELKDGTTENITGEDILLDGEIVEVVPVRIDDCGLYEATLSYKGYRFNYKVKVLPVGEFLLGDVDDDGEITVMDATTIQRYNALLSDFTEKEMLYADVNRDYDVSVIDATVIQRFVAEIIEEF